MAEDKAVIEIRVAVAGDAAAIGFIPSESIAEFRSHYTDAAFRATTPDTDQVRNRLSEGPGWVALLEGAIVGTVSAVSRGPEFYIRGMPSCRELEVNELE